MAKQNLMFTCCFCGHKFDTYPNNAEPVVKGGECCAECNYKYVIPARLMQLNDKK